MFRWMSTIKSKVNAILTILRSTPEETDHLLQRLKNEPESCQNPSIIRGTVRNPKSPNPYLKVRSSMQYNEQPTTGLTRSTYRRDGSGEREICRERSTYRREKQHNHLSWTWRQPIFSLNFYTFVELIRNRKGRREPFGSESKAATCQAPRES